MIPEKWANAVARQEYVIAYDGAGNEVFAGHVVGYVDTPTLLVNTEWGQRSWPVRLVKTQDEIEDS